MADGQNVVCAYCGRATVKDGKRIIPGPCPCEPSAMTDPPRKTDKPQGRPWPVIEPYLADVTPRGKDLSNIEARLAAVEGAVTALRLNVEGLGRILQVLQGQELPDPNPRAMKERAEAMTQSTSQTTPDTPSSSESCGERTWAEILCERLDRIEDRFPTKWPKMQVLVPGYMVPLLFPSDEDVAAWERERTAKQGRIERMTDGDSGRTSEQGGKACIGRGIDG